MPTLRARDHDFQELMRYRIMDILLVATPYDTFLLEEAGELAERVLGEFRNLDLHYAPRLNSVATGKEALEILGRRESVNLVVTTPHVADMDVLKLARRVKEIDRDIPVVVLAWDSSELARFSSSHPHLDIDRTFVWQGDANILFAMMKSVEDWRNVAHDTATVGVQVILLIEDNVRNYSSFLPTMYLELLRQSQRVVSEALNLSQKILRMRARPKVLLCTTYEEAERAFNDYRDNVLGIISDVEFPLRRGEEAVPGAGAKLAGMVRRVHGDIPIVLHSSQLENRKLAEQVEASFLLKGTSSHLLEDLRRVLLQDFGFGEFLFKTAKNEKELDRAADLKSLEDKLREIPEESLLYHAANNHFSRWLKARMAFAVASEIRPLRPADFPGSAALRQALIKSLAAYRLGLGRTAVADFVREEFDFSGDFYRIGGGSLGGKARGLAFVRRLLSQYRMRSRFPGVEIANPATVVVGTDAFEQFLDANDLRHFAIDCDDDAELRRRFETAELPAAVVGDLEAFLARAAFPLAVRSSSLLEDSRQEPVTGVYDTLMLPNNAPDAAERLAQLLLAVKRVYASTYSRQAKAYLAATHYRLEEEKMAVMLQRIVGSVRGERFYPDFSGVARSYAFYPSPPARAEDGVAAVALGLGKGVVDGGACLRFCPRYPHHVPQLSSVADALASTQSEFWALPLSPISNLQSPISSLGMREQPYDLAVAEADGTLANLASTWSMEDDRIYDGVSRPGPRLVTFAPVLKHGVFPLAELISTLLDLGSEAMGSPVEIEFAVNLHPDPGAPAELGFLQMRPLALAGESEAVDVGEPDPAAVVCASLQVLGNGRIEGIRDLVVVDFQRFERSQSRDAAAEIGRLNAKLMADQTPYILIGVGRWGSRDPWLGIPVTWSQVAGARVIVEAGLRDLRVTPSQGSHFFHNLTSFNVGYFTLNAQDGEGFVDWPWLEAQPDLSHAAHVRHLRLDRPVVVKMNGKLGEGVILKPS